MDAVRQDRILILDDDADVGHTLALMAEGLGVSSRCASNIGEFTAALDEWDPTHLAVDLVMPGMDGVEVMRLLGRRGCRARIIISSGVGGRILDAARRSGTEQGLDIAGVLTKPFLMGDLRVLLARPVGGGDRRPARAAEPQVPFEITEAALREATERHEFKLVFQPKVKCRSGALAGFEALARWHCPGQGIVMPDRFIHLAENWGLIDALTQQVLDQALRRLSLLGPGSGLTVSVNISAWTLVDFRIGELAFDLCSRLAIEPRRVIFELTESSAMMDPGAALDMLTRLRMKGFQLSIDDFGTGYSSMVQLVRLPFSEIKVDKSFVLAALQSREARAVTKSIVDLGHSLGLRVTAEGVEDAPTLEFLDTIGCDLAQGYFIARPMAGELVDAWMAGRRPI
jgi:EAL domain-containing protein (putative c-di-GMP-specific phosphodiesterase class I)